jgi:hypothetical protein
MRSVLEKDVVHSFKERKREEALNIPLLSSSMSSRRTVLRLYRQFLKHLRLWPRYEERIQRSIYTHIESSIKTQFRQNKNETNPEKINELIDVAEKELQSMKNLLDNKYFKMVPFHLHMDLIVANFQL